jgi:hypothetical protein
VKSSTTEEYLTRRASAIAEVIRQTQVKPADAGARRRGSVPVDRKVVELDH